MNNAPSHQPLKRALAIFGTQTAMAAALGLRQQSVNAVFKSERPAPAKWCIALERATGGKITRHDLRPDLYPEEREGAASA